MKARHLPFNLEACVASRRADEPEIVNFFPTEMLKGVGVDFISTFVPRQAISSSSIIVAHRNLLRETFACMIRTSGPGAPWTCATV